MKFAQFSKRGKEGAEKKNFSIIVQSFDRLSN